MSKKSQPKKTKGEATKKRKEDSVYDSDDNSEENELDHMIGLIPIISTATLV
jgi:hypothetical protein